MKIDLTRLVTESRNPASEQIDTLSTLDMLQVINQQDQLLPWRLHKLCRKWRKRWRQLRPRLLKVDA